MSCNLCSECARYSGDQAEPEYAAIGMGRCLLRAEHMRIHVGWSSIACESFEASKQQAENDINN